MYQSTPATTFAACSGPVPKEEGGTSRTGRGWQLWPLSAHHLSLQFNSAGDVDSQDTLSVLNLTNPTKPMMWFEKVFAQKPRIKS